MTIAVASPGLGTATRRWKSGQGSRQGRGDRARVARSPCPLSHRRSSPCPKALLLLISFLSESEKVLADAVSRQRRRVLVFLGEEKSREGSASRAAMPIRSAVRAMALRLAMGMVSASASSLVMSSSLRRMAIWRERLSSVVIVAVFLLWGVVKLVEEGLSGDDANDGAELRPRLRERPRAEDAGREGARAARDLAGEIFGDGIVLLMAEGVVDGVGPPERVGGFARHGFGLQRSAVWFHDDRRQSRSVCDVRRPGSRCSQPRGNRRGSACGGIPEPRGDPWPWQRETILMGFQGLSLENELRRRLPAGQTISTIPLFGDFLWDADGSLEEYLALPAAVVVDAPQSSRRIVVQRVRGELRYWITTNPDPAQPDGENELGVIATVDDLLTLCDEFLEKRVRPSDLKTPRWSRGEQRGQGAR